VPLTAEMKIEEVTKSNMLKVTVSTATSDSQIYVELLANLAK